MEAKDIQLIEENSKDNYRLDRLYREHLELENSIKNLTNKGLGANEQKELNLMKKKKLEGREELEKILETLRN